MAERRVLIVEPFFVGSHRAWAEGWRDASRHEIHILGSGDARWRRGMRAGAELLAAETDRWRETNGAPDLVVGTSMLDLASYLGFARRSLGSVRAVQFMHENQLTYPRQRGESLDTGFAWMQWRGLVAADEVWCNSRYHRDALVAGIADLDPEPDSPVDAVRLGRKTWVAHLGVAIDDCRRRVTIRSGPRRPLVVSNQRWHHDKDLGSVLRSLRTARDRGLEFDVALLGDPTGGEADELAPLLADLAGRIVVQGHLARGQYLDVLGRADVVVSAARNENFGLAVVEAVAAGAWPVVPNAVAYPEVIPAEFHGECLYEAGGLGDRLREVLARVASGEGAPAGLADSMVRFDWSAIGPALDDRVDRLLDRSRAV